MTETTWDGQPISPEPPHGAAIVVWRRVDSRVELLVLHLRAVPGDDDWAWGPPSGARWPGEDIADTARRELLEETGIAARPALISGGAADWYTFAVEVAPSRRVALSAEHDRAVWLTPVEAVRRAAPETVRDQVRRVIAACRLVERTDRVDFEHPDPR